MKLIFVLALALISISCSQCNIRQPLDYLQIGGNPHTEELRWVIGQIESGNWGRDVETLAANLKIARQLASEASLRGVDSIRAIDTLGISNFPGQGFYWLNNVLDDFLAFSGSKLVVAPCHNVEARTFIGLVDMHFGGIEAYQHYLLNPPNSLLFMYLQQYGAKHCEECLQTLIERLGRFQERLESDTEEKLDVLVSMGEQFPVDKVDIKLTVKASLLNLASGEFDAKSMLMALKNYIYQKRDEKWLNHVESNGLLSAVLTEACDDLRLKMPFDMYNLARLLVPEIANKLNLPIKFIKLNEYSRVCIPFYRRKTKKDAQTNVINNLIRMGL